MEVILSKGEGTRTIPVETLEDLMFLEQYILKEISPNVITKEIIEDNADEIADNEAVIEKVIETALINTDYDSIDEMEDEIDKLKDALSNIRGITEEVL